MADDLDRAAEQEELERTIALRNRKPELQFIGRCHYCEHPLLNGCFCDADCGQDWEKEQWAKSQRRQVGVNA